LKKMVEDYLISPRRNRLETWRRLALLMRRHGLGSGRLFRQIAAYCACGGKVTLPVPAVILEHYPELIRLPAELAAHGYVHCDTKRLDSQALRRHLEEVRKIFHRIGEHEIGFRAPYLRADHRLLRELSRSGFLYDSSCSIHWEVLPASRVNHRYRSILDYYQSKSAAEFPSLPFVESNMLRIPVSLPDDEMLIDRLRIHDQDHLFRIWSKILSQCCERGEIFVLQLHPERFHLAEKALRRLIQQAQDSGAWIAGLKEVAMWWKTRPGTEVWPDSRPGAFCITGDIDRMSVWDLIKRSTGKDEYLPAKGEGD
jgi:peptidoglycan/xylan/chitin deacetylase (PgdA/CDA1 family)